MFQTYTDTQVDGTQYRALYILNDMEVGLVSDTITVQVQQLWWLGIVEATE
jgi:hypothetical protein